MYINNNGEGEIVMENSQQAIDMQNVTFRMEIDDIFELDEFIPGVIVTGHIDKGTIKPGLSVMIVTSEGNVQSICMVNGIMSQSCLSNMDAKMLDSASDFQDDYWGTALVFNNKKLLDCVDSGMFVIIE